MIMRPPEFVEVLKYLREALPTLTRVTTYARSKTLAQRRPEELKEICEAGLTRIHVGLETGDDELLQIVRKGVTADEEIEGGKKAMEAGFQLSEYWMPDLGGRERWRQHAENTARVLTAINPHYIRSRPFVPWKGTPICEDYERGDLHLSSPHERLEELQLMIQKSRCNIQGLFRSRDELLARQTRRSSFQAGLRRIQISRRKTKCFWIEFKRASMSMNPHIRM